MADLRIKQKGKDLIFLGHGNKSCGMTLRSLIMFKTGANGVTIEGKLSRFYPGKGLFYPDKDGEVVILTELKMNAGYADVPEGEKIAGTDPLWPVMVQKVGESMCDVWLDTAFLYKDYRYRSGLLAVNLPYGREGQVVLAAERGMNMGLKAERRRRSISRAAFELAQKAEAYGPHCDVIDIYNKMEEDIWVLAMCDQAGKKDYVETHCEDIKHTAAVNVKGSELERLRALLKIDDIHKGAGYEEVYARGGHRGDSIPLCNVKFDDGAMANVTVRSGEISYFVYKTFSAPWVNGMDISIDPDFELGDTIEMRVRDETYIIQLNVVE